MPLPAAVNTETRNWSIYKITNPNGRVYIGLTSNEPLRQKNYRNAECYQQKLVYNSIKKYGWDSHKYEIIDTFESTWDFAYNKEMFWIRSYMSNYNKYKDNRGMNLTDGGSGNIGYTMSDETKAKISKINLGRKWNDESRKKMSDYRKGKNFYWPNEETKRKMSLASKGRIITIEARKKISKSCKGRPSPNKGKPMNQKQKEMYYKKILVFDLNGNFITECVSMLDACVRFSVSKNTVGGCARGIIKNPIKFIFKFKKDAINA